MPLYSDKHIKTGNKNYIKDKYIIKVLLNPGQLFHFSVPVDVRISFEYFISSIMRYSGKTI